MALQWGSARDPFFNWDPFSEMRQLHGAMNELFEGVRGTAQARGEPLVNMWLGEKSIAVTAALPGLTQSDIELTVADDTLTIRGERKAPAGGNDVVWHRRERPVGQFARTIQLPFRVDPDSARARFDRGILEVELQRPQSDLPRRIEVSTS